MERDCPIADSDSGKQVGVECWHVHPGSMDQQLGKVPNLETRSECLANGLSVPKR